jgi:hypothetical protein
MMHLSLRSGRFRIELFGLTFQRAKMGKVELLAKQEK